MKFTLLRNLFCTALGAAFTFAPLTTMADPALEKGEKFLHENASKEGVKTTPSGLQYKIVKEGAGKSPKATDTVLVHYRGTLLDGTEFDSSYKRNEPISFPLNGVIPGWTEGLQLLKEGGKAILYIPSKLAYGQRGTPGGPIGPNETLIFEVELLKVQ
jgi:FKBP-type peptidyl-prolyl cis-trans isomerase